MSVKMRQEVERKIAAALIADALKAGYSISVNNGSDEDETKPLRRASAILKAMFQTDDERLYMYRKYKRGNGKRVYVGWVWFVYGNDGWDVISDYTTNLEHIMAGANKISQQYQD